MCMNRNHETKYDVLAGYAVAILTGKPLAELATEKRMTVDQMQEKLIEIIEVNPPVYKQVQEKLGRKMPVELFKCAVSILRGDAVDEIAAENGLTVAELSIKMKDMEIFNPYLYEAVQKKLRAHID